MNSEPADWLQALLAARSVAVVGASEDPDRVGGRPVEYLRRFGFTGEVHLVNPRRRIVQGEPSHRSVRDLARPIDLAVIAVPEPGLGAALADCADAGVAVAVVLTSTTTDATAAINRQILQLRKATGMRTLGPNSLGAISAPTRLTATFSTCLETGDTLPDGGITLVTQSGAIGAFATAAAATQGVGIRHLIATGNEADLGSGEVTARIAADPGTHAIGVYLEGLRDGELFVQGLARAAAAAIPVGVLKVGRSALARQVAETHTGAVVGADDVYRAVLKAHGAQQFDDIQDWVDYLCVSARLRRSAPVGQTAVLSVSGGVGALAADVFDDAGVALAELTDNTCAALREIVPAYATTTNPVDVSGAVVANPELLSRALCTLASDPGVGLITVCLGLQARNREAIERSLINIASRIATPLIVGWIEPPDAVCTRLNEAGVSAVPDIGRALRIAARMQAYSEWTTARPTSSSAPTVGLTVRPRPDEELTTEPGAKRFLADIGIRIPRGRVVTSTTEALQVAGELGREVVIKGVSPGLAHKTEHGLVAIGVPVPDGVPAAVRQVLTSMRRMPVGNLPARVLVEECLDEGIELLVGLVRDPQLGPVLSVSPGGTLADLMAAARVLLPAPTRAEDAATALAASPGLHRLLAGMRGAPPGDVAGLAAALNRISVAFASRPDIAALEINPLLVQPPGRGVVALDAVVVTSIDASCNGES